MPEIIRNCKTCEHFGSDGDGPEYNNNFDVCHLTYCNSDIDEEDDNTDKVGFPFETAQPCHVPGFWQYADLDEELSNMFNEEMDQTADTPSGCSFNKTFKRFKEKYMSAPKKTEEAQKHLTTGKLQNEKRI